MSKFFTLKASNISLLRSPNDFYQTWLKMISSSQHRIGVSTWYFGTGNLEANLEKEMLKSLLNKQIRGNIIMDYSRAHRENANKVSGVTQLQSIGKYWNYYRSPMNSKVFPSIINEILGVYHTKFIICDNNIIITGANLSNSYFTTRKDRYYLIQNEPDLADFLYGYLQCLNMIKYHRNTFQYQQEHLQRLKQYITPNYKTSELISYSKNKLQKGEVWMYPRVQIGCLNINNDYLFLKELLGNSRGYHKCVIHSGYMNISDTLLKILNDNFRWVELYVSSPKANSFYNGGIIKSTIPYLYRVYERNVWSKYPKIKVYEYQKDNWTFHQKGIWLSKNKEDSPDITVIGSSNFNHRSLFRDVEIGFYIFSNSTSFNRMLNGEINMKSDFNQVSLRSIDTDPTFRIRKRHCCLARILKGYL